MAEQTKLVQHGESILRFCKARQSQYALGRAIGDFYRKIRLAY